MSSKVETPRKMNCKNIDLTKLFGTCMEKDGTRKKTKGISFTYGIHFCSIVSNRKKGKRIKKRKQIPI